jgi:hypothetical protein
METRTRLLDRLGGPIDPARLVLFRAAFGAILAVLVLRYFVHGWIDAQFHDPRHFFPWEGLEWIRPWPRPWMHVHFAALGLLALGIAAGLFYRTSAALFCLGFTYVHLIDKTNYLNHYYLVSLLTGLMAFLPLGRAGSLDVRWGRVPRLAAFPAWTSGILRFQVGVVYFFAGVAKLQEDWLFRAQPLRLWLSSGPELPLLGEPWVAYAMSWAGAAFDLALPALLLWRPARPWAFAAAALFHAATAALFPIGLFPWIMLASLLVFLPPRSPSPPVAPAPTPRLAAALLAAYALLQVAVPLRHWLHPGDVLWTEEGFRFSWRVMIAEKAARARFSLRDPATGETRGVDVADYLTPVQAHFMAIQPDLVRQFVELLRREAARPGEEVVAEVDVSLNGRPSRPFVTPHPPGGSSLGGGGCVPREPDVKRKSGSPELYHGEELLTAEQVERIYRVTDALDLHRDWVVVPLKSAEEGLEQLMVDAKILIRAPGRERFEPWLAGLRERLLALGIAHVPRRGENDPKFGLTGLGQPRLQGTLRHVPEGLWRPAQTR